VRWLDGGRHGGPGGVDEVQLSVRCELHGALGMLLGAKVIAEGVSMKLSTVAWCQWRTTARIGRDPATENEGKRVRAVGHLQGLLGEEVEGGGLTIVVRIWLEATETLFTRNGEKWEISELMGSQRGRSRRRARSVPAATLLGEGGDVVRQTAIGSSTRWQW
jgi:hypothetical protein